MPIRASLAPPGVDWDAAHRETVEHLRRAIQINTTNPPGDELFLARYLNAALTAAGIETRLFESPRNRAALVGRIPGTGAADPIMLLAHMDVVGVEAEKWSVDPFGGEIRDGYLYGRGAIDDKGMLATNLATMLLLQRCLAGTGVRLPRDVVFVATSDEEAGGEYGIRWLLENHPEVVRAEFALNEGGRIRIVEGKTLYAAVQTAEKVSHVLTVTARGPGGHASVPLTGNAIAHLGRAISAISAHREKIVLLPVTQRFFGDLAKVWPDKREAEAMSDVASGDESRMQKGSDGLAHRPMFDALLRSGVAPTMLSAGVHFNVLPAEAQLTVNVRTLPGESIDDIVSRLSSVVNDPAVDIALTVRGAAAPSSDFESPMFTAIADTVRDLAPTTVTIPYLGTGATESALLRSAGIQAYGILPFPLDETDERRMHSHDERVPLAALEFGLRLVFGAVWRAANTSQ